ncbi:MAG: hypothetical protein EBU88_01125 [Acidobacteria bacterium]|nr:hypothetical protein [Acidobacteriota bacterium]
MLRGQSPQLTPKTLSGDQPDRVFCIRFSLWHNFNSGEKSELSNEPEQAERVDRDAERGGGK